MAKFLIPIVLMGPCAFLTDLNKIWAGDEIVLVPVGEPGEPLVVTGTVYLADGVTPAALVKLYVYHTDIHGYYSKGGLNESKRRLSATFTTDDQGRFRFRTIRPAPYPGQGPPAHIHFVITKPDGGVMYRDLWFEDDPLISPVQRSRYAGEGAFSQIRPLRKDDQGVWQCVRDFKLTP